MAGDMHRRVQCGASAVKPADDVCDGITRTRYLRRPSIRRSIGTAGAIREGRGWTFKSWCSRSWWAIPSLGAFGRAMPTRIVVFLPSAELPPFVLCRGAASIEPAG